MRRMVYAIIFDIHEFQVCVHAESLAELVRIDPVLARLFVFSASIGHLTLGVFAQEKATLNERGIARLFPDFNCILIAPVLRVFRGMDRSVAEYA